MSTWFLASSKIIKINPLKTDQLKKIPYAKEAYLGGGDPATESALQI